MIDPTTKPKLKDLPTQPKRGKIYEMYGRQYDIPSMRENLNDLIEEFKNAYQQRVGKPLKMGSRQIPRLVWIRWLHLFGFPPGYTQETDWFKELES